uniref:Chemokine interleukin-8-like domain-containing protein n=1 Tax=Lates calcarifer TaxID=8187 RepID=A0A4W6D051_LATCA
IHSLSILVICDGRGAHGPNEMSPASCCFKFFPKRIPKPHIISIIKTHKRCSEKAFVPKQSLKESKYLTNIYLVDRLLWEFIMEVYVYV